MTVGPDNIPGYEKVEELATCLVTLRRANPPISAMETQTIVRLWEALNEYDNAPTTFPVRHKDRLTKGRFKVAKSKSSVAPGVDSTRRYTYI